MKTYTINQLMNKSTKQLKDILKKNYHIVLNLGFNKKYDIAMYIIQQQEKRI